MLQVLPNAPDKAKILLEKCLNYDARANHGSACETAADMSI